MNLFKSKNKHDAKRQEAALSVILEQADSFFLGDEMLVANKNTHFLEDPVFSRLLSDLAKHPQYSGMAWRLHVLCWAVSLAMRVEGSCIECGVFRGFKSLFLLNYFGAVLAKREYYLFDTYEGIDESLSAGSPICKEERSKVRLYDFVVHRFREFSNVSVIKGSVPKALGKVEIDQVAFLHLDMNSYEAEIGALDALWEKIPVGGVVVLDDFGLLSHSAQMEHELPWFKQRGQDVLELPTGQALVVKQ